MINMEHFRNGRRKNPQSWQTLYNLWQNKDKELLGAQIQPGQPGAQRPNLII